MEPKDYINVRVRKETQRKLKIVAALRQESMLETLERLVSQEFDRLQERKGTHDTLQKDQT